MNGKEAKIVQVPLYFPCIAPRLKKYVLKPEVAVSNIITGKGNLLKRSDPSNTRKRDAW